MSSTHRILVLGVLELPPCLLYDGRLLLQRLLVVLELVHHGPEPGFQRRHLLLQFLDPVLFRGEVVLQVRNTRFAGIDDSVCILRAKGTKAHYISYAYTKHGYNEPANS